MLCYCVCCNMRHTCPRLEDSCRIDRVVYNVLHAIRPCRIVLVVIRPSLVVYLSSTPRTPFAHRFNSPLPRLCTGNPVGSLPISSSSGGGRISSLT